MLGLLIITVAAESPDRFEYWFKKWYLKMVACAIDDSDNPPCNELILILSGEGNVGKSELPVRLLPKELQQFHSMQQFDFSNNLFERNMAHYLIMEHDDLDNISPKDLGSFKRLATLSAVTYRNPYDKYQTTSPRRASLCGTSNQFGLIKDPTGNRRMVGCEILSIDFARIDKVSRHAMLKEAVSIIGRGSFEFKITQDDIASLNNGQLEKFAAEDPDEETLLEYFLPALKSSKEVVHLTFSQIVRVIETQGKIRVYRHGFSALLKKNNFVKKSTRKVEGRRTAIYAYAVVLIKSKVLYDLD